MRFILLDKPTAIASPQHLRTLRNHCVPSSRPIDGDTDGDFGKRIAPGSSPMSKPAVVFALLLALSSCASPPRPVDPPPTPPGESGAREAGGRGLHGDCRLGAGPLSEPVKRGIERALIDERLLEASHALAQAKHGNVAPFRNITRAEQQHQRALEDLLMAHRAEVPGERPSGKPTGSTLAEACDIASQLERRNVALYEELLATDLPADVRCVFEQLQRASRDNHEAAFSRCSRQTPP